MFPLLLLAACISSPLPWSRTALLPGPCADGTWSGWRDPTGLLVVSAAGDDDTADGTPDHPFATLRAALEASRGRATVRVALGTGTFPTYAQLKQAPFTTGRSLEVAGCGASETVVTPKRHTGQVLEMEGPNPVSLSRLAIEGGHSPLRIGDGARATVSDVTIRDGARRGVVIIGQDTEATLRDVHVADTWNGRTRDEADGHGISILGARVTLERVQVSGSNTFGVFADRGTLQATDLIVAQSGKSGIYAMHMASVDVERCTISTSRGVGILLLDVVSSRIAGCSVTRSRNPNQIEDSDGIVVRRSFRRVSDRGPYKTALLGNVVSDTPRMGIAVWGVDAELTGNRVEGGYTVEGTGIFVGPHVAVSGTDAWATLDREVTPIGPADGDHGGPQPGHPPPQLP